MRAVTSAQIAELDRRASEQHGIAVAALMDAAGRRTAQAASELLLSRPGRVTVLAGKGNNGGDGFVAARYLASQGLSVQALLIAPEADCRGDPLRALNEARAAGVEVQAPDGATVGSLLSSTSLIIDAIFGTGFRGPARGSAAAFIEAANAAGGPTLAVDVPSGLNADTGRPEGPCIRAKATVTMGLPKIGLLLYPGAALAGQVYVADIGYPQPLLDESGITTHLVTAEMVRGLIPSRIPDSHKGTYGRTLVVAGSVGYTGAAVLAALGALRGGAGLVTVAVPEAVYPIVAAHVTEAMPRPLPDAAGALSEQAVSSLEGLMEASDALAVGPGLSTAGGVRSVVESALRAAKPVVIDADGLNVLAGRGEIIRDAAGPVVITPHPGELARLLRSSAAAISADRLGAARTAARTFRCVAVLKGAATVVAAPDGEAYINPTGNAGMAAGGMGDVLTGAIASLIGQGLRPLQAAWVAVYLHGLAADLIAAERGMAGMLASEVAHRLPVAIAQVMDGTAPERIRLLTG